MRLLTVPSLFIIFRRLVSDLNCLGSADLQLEMSFFCGQETHCSLFTPETPKVTLENGSFRSEEGTMCLLTAKMCLLTEHQRRVRVASLNSASQSAQSKMKRLTREDTEEGHLMTKGSNRHSDVVPQ